MAERRGDLPEREHPDNEGTALTPRERETAAELRLLDPHLAGLYEKGVLLARDIEQPGAAYLVVYIGRELSRGVLRLLLEEEGLELTDEDLSGAPTGERNRATISKALHLSADDPRVDEWFRLPGMFAGWEKHRLGGPPPADVRAAFERLSALLFGRVAPYYVTEAELDALLDVETPTAEHVRRLRDLQLRPAQRIYFFGKLKSASWVEALAAEGFFKSPPERRVNADSSWSARPWPEGHYLMQAAPDNPAAVATVLESIPSTNDNPVVWELVAKAACQLPPELAVRSVPRLASAATSVPARFFTESVVELVVGLAAAGRVEAFDLARYLLYIESPEAVKDRDGVRYGFRTDWVVPRFGWHDQQRLLDRMIAALVSLDAERTLRLLFEKVQRIQNLARALDLTYFWLRAESGRRPDRGDVAAMVVESTGDVAESLASRGPDDAARVMEILDSYEGDFFVRIGYRVLAAAGHHLQARLDQILRSPEAVDPEHPATQFAAMLRAQFRNASPDARRAFAEAVKAGPGEDYVKAIFAFRGAASPSHDELSQVTEAWQRRLLTLFRGDIPDELRSLASDLGVLEVKPSYREQQLAEVGSYSEGGFSGGARSPVSVEQLAAWTPVEIVSFLCDLAPDADREISFGLHATLSAYTREHPAAALAVLREAIDREIEPGVIENLLFGLGESLKTGAALDWQSVFEGVRRVVRRVASVGDPDTAHLVEWRRVVGYAARLIRDGCAEDLVPADLTSEVWEILGETMNVPAVWDVADPHDEKSLGAICTGMLNDATGLVANAVVSAALWHYRSGLPEEGERTESARGIAREPVRSRLVSILDRWLQDDGPNAAIPRAVMGQYLPQLYLLVPEWLDSHAADLLERGIEDPTARPTWTAYVSSDLYDTVFSALRPWYVSAAEDAARWKAAAGDVGATREVTERFAVHLIVAVLRGLVSVGDQDRLLELAYLNLHPADWGHAYWTVFRGWTDATEPVPEAMVERLVSLWEWRVSELEKNPESAATIEEAKGLDWLFKAPYIQSDDLIRLGQATARLARGQLELHGQWDRLLTLAQSDPDGVFEIVETVLLAELRTDFPYVPTDDVRPVLEHVLITSGPAVQARLRRLINKLGERGYRDVKDLLDGKSSA